MSRQGTVASVCALLIWMGGCPKRQETKSVLVYVPAPPPAAATPATEPQVMVIEEPPPPPEPEKAPIPPAPEPAAPRRHPARTATPTGPDEATSPDNVESPPPAEVPVLAPRESSAQEAELRNQYLKLEQDIRQRLVRLSNAQLASNERKTVEDARAFFAQATQAMVGGDLPRALNLARKASLLLAALE